MPAASPAPTLDTATVQGVCAELRQAQQQLSTLRRVTRALGNVTGNVFLIRIGCFFPIAGISCRAQSERASRRAASVPAD
jgi:hypothetical protein